MNAIDLSALKLLSQTDGALATIVGIDGSYSRNIGSHLAIAWDGRMAGSLADGCLEAEIATRAHALRGSPGEVFRFGKGSSVIDLRLPCGSGLDLLIDPEPDRAAISRVVDALDARHSAILELGARFGPLHYTPLARIVALGSGPEVDVVEQLAKTMDIPCVTGKPGNNLRQGLSLGRAPADISIDQWTAILLLFHDHEWDGALLDWALSTPAFHIGAIGGAKTRHRRRERLAARNVAAPQIARVRSPAGLIPGARDPATLALSVVAEVIDLYHSLGDAVTGPLSEAVND